MKDTKDELSTKLISDFIEEFEKELEVERNIIKKINSNGYTLDKLIQKETLLDAQTSYSLRELDNEKNKINKLKSKIGESYGK